MSSTAVLITQKAHDLRTVPQHGMGSISESVEYDAVLIGAGFGGYTMLPKLRKLGLRAKIFERGSGSGGVWLVSESCGNRRAL